MPWAMAIAAGLAIAGTTYIAIGIVRPWLISRGVIDIPNHRSSHQTPRARGAGLAVIAVILPTWLIWAALAAAPWPAAYAVPGFAAILAAVSWRDDLTNLPPWPRLVVHVAAALVLVWSVPGAVFQGLLSPAADTAVATGLLVWFINAYNFMDGIDGITGVETVAIGAGLAAVALLSGNQTDAGPPFILATAAIGFLLWNWAPARVFLGDVGSVPLGALIGWTLLAAAADGQWAAAAILPAYYLADATITLGRRLLTGKNVFAAHREHFYQRAIKHGRSHATVATAVAVANTALIGHAVIATRIATAYAWLAVVSAAFAVAGLLIWMALPARTNPDHS